MSTQHTISFFLSKSNKISSTGTASNLASNKPEACLQQLQDHMYAAAPVTVTDAVSVNASSITSTSSSISTEECHNSFNVREENGIDQLVDNVPEASDFMGTYCQCCGELLDYITCSLMLVLGLYS